MQSRRRWSIRRHAAVLDVLEPRVLFSYTFSSLGSFQHKVTGSQPQGLVIDGAGNLFGVTATGGAKGYGTVFEIAAGSETITTLYNFTGRTTANPKGGICPRGILILDHGNLYGITVSGGEFNKGTIFEVADIAAGTASTLTTLASFAGSNGMYPFAGLVIDSAGNLYGTTLGSATANYGSTVFELATGSGTITTLATFTKKDRLEGTLVVDSSGDIFGTTAHGGTKGWGSVFQISGTTHTLSTLVYFNNTNGATPTGMLLQDAQHNLIGMTNYGGSNGYGTIFEVPATASSSIVTLATFTGSNGSHPLGTLLRDDAGNLFGVTASGGSKGLGTVFERAAGTANTITTLFSFTGASTGVNPSGPLVNDTAGNLWGVTYLGGAHSYNAGTVFKLTDNIVTTTPGGAAALVPVSNAGLRLVIAQRPSSVTSGKAFTLVLNVVDAQEHLVTTVNSAVTLALTSGPAAGAYTETYTLKFVNGSAKFMGLILRDKGTYALEAESAALAGVLNGAITVA
jgi:uncharacterized repeat protein (TIGR03803 family)